jgi:hypothetical protein
MAKQGILPNDVTFNILFDGISRARDVRRIVPLMNVMKEHNVVLTVVVLNTMLKAFGTTSVVPSFCFFFFSKTIMIANENNQKIPLG